jgi:exosortase/archaeosortase family protein
MRNLLSSFSRSIPLLRKTLPFIGIIAPFLVLYILYPSSFDLMWKGRMFYLFFLWLLFVETIINMDLARSYSVVPEFVQFVPLSIEYLILTGLFIMIFSLYYGIRQTSDFAISMIFLGVIGAIYMIDTLYPWGRFTPFQMFAPTTTQLSASILNLMGYNTSIVMKLFPNEGTLPVLTVQDTLGHIAVHPVAWVCSGVESLIIFSVTIPLFFKNSTIPWKHRAVYFIFGAAITYFINALRIASIFIIDINGGDWNTFHNVYGMLYSMTWIVSYPLLIIGSRTLWTKIRIRKGQLNSDVPAPSSETIRR